jgi:hypothetical protein
MPHASTAAARQAIFPVKRLNPVAGQIAILLAR